MPGDTIGVVGCGLMGSGIGEVCARAGLRVVIIEAHEDLLAGGEQRVLSSLSRADAAGKLQERLEDVRSRLSFSTDMTDLDGSDIIFEAIAEDEAAKRRMFAALSSLNLGPDTILATNTSSIPIIKLAVETTTPERVLGIHFFNPVPVMPLVELVPSLLTSDAVLEQAEAFVSEILEKTPIRSQDRAGFVVNALLVPYLLSAVRMVESGFASPEDVDTGMVKGCRHPMGPLALADLIGLDTIIAVADSLHAEFREPHYSPPPLLSRMVQAGLTGRKAGRGFYEYR